MSRRPGRFRRPARPGLATLEVVIATAITLPMAVLFLALGTWVCKNVFEVIGTLVGWPHL